MGLQWLMGEDALALSGTVKDKMGAAVAGAIVSLVSDPSIRQTTDADGEFTIDRPVSIGVKGSNGMSDRILFGLGIKANSLQIVLPASAPSGTIAFFAVHGKKRSEVPIGPMKAGTHLVELPLLAPGLYSMWIDLGRFSCSAHLVHSAVASTVIKKKSGGRHASEGAQEGPPLRRGDAGAVDALRVERPGFAPAGSPIASYSQTGIAIVLNPVSRSVSRLPPAIASSASGSFTSGTSTPAVRTARPAANTRASRP
jgi:hypothetical protein